MKRIIALLVTLLAMESFANCTVYAPKKVICRGVDQSVAIYHMTSENSWMSKIYYPKSAVQTEAVYYRRYKSFDLKKICLLATELKSIEDSIEIPLDMRPEISIDCENKQADYLYKIEKGVEVEIPAFDLAFGEPELVSAMYCMDVDYVRTFKYNKVTQLETDRKDYQWLAPGTYCKDFLVDKEIYWTPKKKSKTKSLRAY